MLFLIILFLSVIFSERSQTDNLHVSEALPLPTLFFYLFVFILFYQPASMLKQSNLLGNRSTSEAILSGLVMLNWVSLSIGDFIRYLLMLHQKVMENGSTGDL